MTTEEQITKDAIGAYFKEDQPYLSSRGEYLRPPPALCIAIKYAISKAVERCFELAEFLPWDVADRYTSGDPDCPLGETLQADVADAVAFGFRANLEIAFPGAFEEK